MFPVTILWGKTSELQAEAFSFLHSAFELSPFFLSLPSKRNKHMASSLQGCQGWEYLNGPRLSDRSDGPGLMVS